MATAVQAPNVSRVPLERESDHKAPSQNNGRRRERLKLRLPVQVRPFDARFIDIEDIGEVLDFTRDGLYFVTCMPHYLLGMRLIVTFPFGEKASAHHRYLGSVVRLAERPDGTRGIAVRFLA